MEVVGGSQRGGDGGGGEEEEEAVVAAAAGAGAEVAGVAGAVARAVAASEGLEEGEVEGETLLIVEAEDQDQDQDQASLDLSHDQSGDSLNSDVGEEAEERSGWSEDTTAFHCDKCHKWIPAGQLRGEQPSYLKGDNFFKLVCCHCSEDGKESFERMRLTWQQVVMLAMYNLSLEGTGRQGYFRWKEDICAFIGRHWNFLLGSRKKTSTWWSTVAGCLSVGSPTFFRSGAQEFGEPGWWKLVQNRPPTLRPDGDKTSVAALKAKAGPEPLRPNGDKISVAALKAKAGPEQLRPDGDKISVAALKAKAGPEQLRPNGDKISVAALKAKAGPEPLRPDGDKISVDALKAKAPSRPALDPTITVEGLRKRGGRNPVESAMHLKEKRSRTQEAKDIRRAQKEAACGGGGGGERSDRSSSSGGGGGGGGLMVVSGAERSSGGGGGGGGLMVVSGGYGSGGGSSSASSTPVKMSSSSSGPLGRGVGVGAEEEERRRHGAGTCSSDCDSCDSYCDSCDCDCEVIDFSSLSSSDRTPLSSPSHSPSPDFSSPGTPASHSATPSLLSEADLIPDAMPPQALFHDDEELDGESMIDPGMEAIPPASGPPACPCPCPLLPPLGVAAALLVRKKLRPAALIKQEPESEEDEDDLHHLHHHYHHHHHQQQQQQHRVRMRGSYHHHADPHHHHHHHLHDDHQGSADRKVALPIPKDEPAEAGVMLGGGEFGTPSAASSGGGAGGGVPPRVGAGNDCAPSSSPPSPPPSSSSGPRPPRLAPLGPHEERALLRRLEACPQALAVTPEARRLRRKLLVRQALRERGRPLLDLDKAVSAALCLVGGVYGGVAATVGGQGGGGGGAGGGGSAGEGGVVGRGGGAGGDGTGGVGRATMMMMMMRKYRTSGQDMRILDRFQTPVSSRKSVQQQSVSFWHRLMGTDMGINQGIKSAYTSRVLKPFIRRDYETRPLKLRLLAEIRAHPHRHADGWRPPAEAPIDYCYVRPNHIASVNAMCNDMFWPGVDLSECLQYPDFSVVALYKKVVVGFGFMVPDVKYNEAYISFLLVHPEWRRAGIATFMIYHLIQTCMGKDVTLHVSASNPAMLLYQKFGFKTEEYVLDFYDKYYPVDSNECRHAFFLRLRR
ncbi:hypothetical protein ACEWY4_017137 [Coilia grayii]|uniref:Cysteine-rich protein 2-binding protein n=1 Tax=Coilia grayii TaxID=363190 RepID=A0ABD1JFY8_9TELE